MKLLYCIIVFLIGTFIFSSCQKKETLSNIPAITFNSFLANTLDSAILEVNFTDGDGDIGYLGDPADAKPDVFVEYLRDSANVFVPMIINNGSGNTIITSSYSIPDVTPAGKDKSLRGIIRVKMENWVQGLPLVGDTLQFKTWIFDRAGNKSNIVTTPAVVVP